MGTPDFVNTRTLRALVVCGGVCVFAGCLASKPKSYFAGSSSQTSTSTGATASSTTSDPKADASATNLAAQPVLISPTPQEDGEPRLVQVGIKDEKTLEPVQGAWVTIGGSDCCPESKQTQACRAYPTNEKGLAFLETCDVDGEIALTIRFTSDSPCYLSRYVQRIKLDDSGVIDFAVPCDFSNESVKE